MESILRIRINSTKSKSEQKSNSKLVINWAAINWNNRPSSVEPLNWQCNQWPLAVWTRNTKYHLEQLSILTHFFFWPENVAVFLSLGREWTRVFGNCWWVTSPPCQHKMIDWPVWITLTNYSFIALKHDKAILLKPVDWVKMLFLVSNLFLAPSQKWKQYNNWPTLVILMTN